MPISTLTAYCPNARSEFFGGQYHIYDGMDHHIGVADSIHGFIHYTGSKGTAHEGVHAVIRPHNVGSSLSLLQELKTGIVNGRDDRR